MKPSRDISALLSIMAALRTPGTGCSWDLDQRFETIVPYTIEEAYEVADAVARGDLADLRDELGDLLLQVVFHARMAEEAGHFDFGDVVEAVTAKMIRRHPHIFGDTGRLPPEAVRRLWEEIKAQERAERRNGSGKDGQGPAAGVLSGVPLALPALTRALKLQAKAGAVGFDWNDPRAVLAKIVEESGEIADALESGDRVRIADEVGDLLFAVVNLARHAATDPEDALRGANAKFARRFAFIEQSLAAQGRAPAESSLAEMDALWDEAKAREKREERKKRKEG